MAEAGEKSDCPPGAEPAANAGPSQPPAGQVGNVEDASDRMLLERLRHGQPDAAEDLYGRYAQRLQALAAVQSGPDLAARVDPEDIVQSVFRTFFRRASLGQYDVPEGSDLWRLLLVIALNKIRATGAHHRAAKRDVRMTAHGEAFDEALRTTTEADQLALAELRLDIEQLLQQLPESQRAIVQLRIQDHDIEEIARQTKRSRRTVERALQDFRTRLTALLLEDG
jgi:RNA polymerase sigma factor (sigma-70 family)